MNARADSSAPNDDEHNDRPTNGRAGSSDEWWVEFRELLDEETDWPTTYTFKFITPQDGLGELKELFEGHPASEEDLKVRSSSKGNYVSVTARLRMNSSDEVLDVYDRAYEIDDVIAL
ncbi:MAG: DUF493 domain-containing protein [Bacteroidetes bacterium QS_9_68_14]|nr:MAG: DUF493 domain-containing protein [Bacteroidetes bacterium QS_9_68_14]